MSEENPKATAPAAEAPPAQWYQKGYGGLAAEAARIESGGEPPWFFLNQDEERHVLFLDDEPVSIYMHEYAMGDQWNLHCTCLKNIYDDAPCCELLGEKSRVFLSLFPIVDLDVYQPKKGKGGPQRNRLAILPAKFGTAKLIEKEKRDEVSLIGKRIRMGRIGQKAAKAGTNIKTMKWQLKGKEPFAELSEENWRQMAAVATYRGKKWADLAALANGDEVKLKALGNVFDLSGVLKDGKIDASRIPVFNFLKLYAPKTPRELRTHLKGASVTDFDAKDGKDGKDSGKGTSSERDDAPARNDDVPF